MNSKSKQSTSVPQADRARTRSQRATENVSVAGPSRATRSARAAPAAIQKPESLKTSAPPGTSARAAKVKKVGSSTSRSRSRIKEEPAPPKPTQAVFSNLLNGSPPTAPPNMIKSAGRPEVHELSDDEDGSGDVLGSLPQIPVGSSNGAGAYKPKRTSLEVMTEQLQILLTFEEAPCSFCTVVVRVGEGIVLQDCMHGFCRSCISTAVEASNDSEIKCPLFDECHGSMLEREVKALLPPDKFEKYLKRSVSQACAEMGNVFHCKFKGCSGFCVFETGSKVFLCPACNKSNCLKCNTIHEGLECKQYDELIQASLRSGKSLEEAQALIVSKAGNGWDQMMGTVAGWLSTSAAGTNLGVIRNSLVYSRVLHRMATLDLWPNTHEFECLVCFDTVPIGEGIIFQECLHMCCRECSVALIENSDAPTVKCPYQDANYSCIFYLKPREIRALASPVLYEKHLSRSMKLAENAMANTFHCKTRDCQGWCEFEEGAKVFQCQLCGKKNCLSCKAIHEKVSCEDYKNRLVQGENDLLSDAAIEDIVKKGLGMRCPRCKTVVQKMSGCDWIVCSLCQTEICWATKGPRWGPAGKGDTSGGCRCRVNNRLCVPHCGNCH